VEGYLTIGRYIVCCVEVKFKSYAVYVYYIAYICYLVFVYYSEIIKIKY